MGDEQVDTLRRALAAFDRNDFEDWIVCISDEHVTTPVPEWPENAPLEGADAAWAFYRQWAEVTVPNAALRLEEPARRRELVTGVVRTEVVGPASGAVVEFALGVIATFDGDRIARMDWFRDVAEAERVARERLDVD